LVTRYGRTRTVTIYERRCLWYGVFRSQPVRVILIRELRRPDLALVTTDQNTLAARLAERYAARWAIEVAFSEAKHITGVGEARNRTRIAVERTVPSDCSPRAW
jgi:IS4 transposase